MNTKLKLLLLVAIVSILTTIPSATAHINDQHWNLTGRILETADGHALSGVTVSNGSNSTTTNSTGWYTLNLSNKTEIQGWTLSLSLDGYTSNTTNSLKNPSFGCWINGADNSTCHGNMTIVATTQSDITESVTKTTATVGWSVTHAYVGNRILYGLDSGLNNNVFTSVWANSTGAPSIKLQGLIPDRTYYYTIQSYNLANSGTSSDSENGNFKTSVAGSYIEEDDETLNTPVTYQPQPSGIGSFVTSMTSSNNLPLTFALIGAIGLVAWYFDLLGGNKGGKGRKPRK